MNTTNTGRHNPKRCSIIIALLIFITRAVQSDDQQKLAWAHAGFAFKLLQEIAKEQPSENIFISPYSASTVLEMVCNGAAGQTKSEMQKVLETTGLAADSLNAAIQNCDRSINSQGANAILTTANSLWYRKGIPVKREFISCNQRFFGATVAELDFDDPSAVGVINAWAAEKTHGRINHVADGLLNPLTELFLANAVYFKGKWVEQFDAKRTQDREFQLRGGSQTQCPMMEQTRRFAYQQESGFQAVRLPYKGSLAMYVFLPDTNSGPEKLLGALDGNTWLSVTKPKFSDREGTVVLPKFKIEYGVELKQPLIDLGMRAAFEIEKADFSGISGIPLLISAVRQKTFIEVKEEGTEAAAVTGIAVMAKGIHEDPPDAFQMIVDRPFLFLIEDERTRTILFMGVVFDPAPSV